ncbi:hypothetical protein PCANC_04691 [Puccinia coronata f. sp. avenae]|uniref:Uncharacterized protein n=1 Tax=Puccinia coronata f. sp. avenae TaxID=200324 RepID=A0A2N5W1J4_9BASI|nr:hypothetical protein PCANC_04691 [Puccinia coronata f. sp. avenae]
MNWPFKMTVNGELYTLISRGFYSKNEKHYWVKVIRNIQGIVGVWLQNDLQNDGRAQLVITVPGSIGGPQQHTSWLFYSRCWTPNENAFVNESIEQIHRDNPKLPRGIHFSYMQSIMQNSTNHGTLDINEGTKDLGATPLAASIPKLLIMDINDNGHDDVVACQGEPEPALMNDLPMTQPPLKIRIRRPPNTSVPLPLTEDTLACLDFSLGNETKPDASDHQSVSAPPTKPISSSQAKLVVQADKPAAKRGRPKKAPTDVTSSTCQPEPLKAAAKHGRPKKTPHDATSFTFQPKPLTDADWDCIDARGAAWFDVYWATQDLTVENSQKDAQLKPDVNQLKPNVNQLKPNVNQLKPDVTSNLCAGGDIVQKGEKKSVALKEGQSSTNTGVCRSTRLSHGKARIA